MKILNKYAFSFFTPESDQTVTEWCEENLHIGKGSEMPGPYSTRLFPYVREVLESFKASTVSDVCLVWGSQTAKTQTYLAGMAWAVAKNRNPILFAAHSENQVRKISKSRWMPMVDESEKLSALKPADSDYFQVLHQQFGTADVVWIGANSAGNASSTPVGLVIQDEVDKYRTANDKEAGIAYLIDERTKGFSRSKRFKSSTPTTDRGTIWTEWEKSDKRYYFVPCPHCGEMIKLEKKGVHWDQDACDKDGKWDVNRVRQSAHYRCPHCDGVITDSDKPRMLDRGEWRATAPNADRLRRGYHLNSLYSPMVTFGKFAAKWVEDSGEVEGLQNLINSWLAEPWRDKVIDARSDRLATCEGAYDRGDKMGEKRVLMADTQRTDFAYNVRGYADGKSFLIDHGRVPSWEDLDALQEKHDCYRVGIDTGGDRTQEVYEAIADRKHKGWFGLKGVDSMTLPYQAKKIDPFVGKARQGKLVMNGITLFTVNTNIWRTELARRRIGMIPSWTVYRSPHTGYVRELFSEYQVEVIRKKKRVTEWRKKSKDNHQFDLETYHIAASRWLKLTRKFERLITDHGSAEEPEQDESQQPSTADKVDEGANSEEIDDPYVPMSQRHRGARIKL